MKLLKVFIDDELITDSAIGWYVSGSYLVITYKDGSNTGHTGFVDFKIQVVENERPFDNAQAHGRL